MGEVKLLDPFLVEKSAAGCCAVLVGKRRMGGGGVVECVYVCLRLLDSSH